MSSPVKLALVSVFTILTLILFGISFAFLLHGNFLYSLLIGILFLASVFFMVYFFESYEE